MLTPRDCADPLRRAMVLSACALPWLAQAARSPEEAYPDRPVRFVVPYTAGSVGDLFLRQLAESLTRKLGQAFIIDNRPGASQAIGAIAVAKSAPDGYTLFLGSQSGMVLSSLARKKASFDPFKDFAPVSMLFTAPLFLCVNTAVKATRVDGLIAMAKANPGKLTFASIGPGTTSHLAGELFKSMAGVDLLHVPYLGGPAASNALAGGEVDMMFNGGNVLSYVAMGKVRVLGAGSAQRVASKPELPTVAESGLPGFDVSPWFALFAPAGTPQPLVMRINKEIAIALKEPQLAERAAALALEIEPSTPKQLASRLAEDFPVWEKVMRKAGIQRE
ncbi:MAG TPA: tripartite tricarboxylate transporter substrate binding protein [Ramlibacter sp.]|nr:tripartite tricarboxylate transporter substrate binding protein [Ramlibacter sp.]